MWNCTSAARWIEIGLNESFKKLRFQPTYTRRLSPWSHSSGIVPPIYPIYLMHNHFEF
jgi:hypothetical protein